jgi:hypothetical protein
VRVTCELMLAAYVRHEAGTHDLAASPIFFCATYSKMMLGDSRR